MQLETLILINENLIAIQLILTSSRASEREREREKRGQNAFTVTFAEKVPVCLDIILFKKRERKNPCIL